MCWPGPSISDLCQSNRTADIGQLLEKSRLVVEYQRFGGGKSRQNRTNYAQRHKPISSSKPFVNTRPFPNYHHRLSLVCVIKDPARITTKCFVLLLPLFSFLLFSGSVGNSLVSGRGYIFCRISSCRFLVFSVVALCP